MQKIFLALFITLTLTLSHVMPVHAIADPTGQLKTVARGADYNTSASIESVAGVAVKGFLSILGVIFLGLLIYGGYTWMTAQGNEEGVGTAKKIITAAVIGLIIIMASYAVTDFVLKNLETQTLQQ